MLFWIVCRVLRIQSTRSRTEVHNIYLEILGCLTIKPHSFVQRILIKINVPIFIPNEIAKTPSKTVYFISYHFVRNAISQKLRTISSTPIDGKKTE